MTTDPHPDYAPLRCKTHDKAYCEKCVMISSSAHDAGLVIQQTAYDKIHRVDYSCSTHTDSAMIVACKKCVQEQLKAEYERGMKEALPPGAESETIKELQRQLAQEQEAAYKYWKEKRDMEKDYAALKQCHENAKKQIAVAHRIVGAMKLNGVFSPSLQQALKEWDAL